MPTYEPRPSPDSGQPDVQTHTASPESSTGQRLSGQQFLTDLALLRTISDPSQAEGEAVAQIAAADQHLAGLKDQYVGEKVKVKTGIRDVSVLSESTAPLTRDSLFISGTAGRARVGQGAYYRSRVRGKVSDINPDGSFEVQKRRQLLLTDVAPQRSKGRRMKPHFESTKVTVRPEKAPGLKVKFPEHEK